MNSNSELNRRQFLTATSAAAAAVMLETAVGQAQNQNQNQNASPPPRPNILYIHSHDTGRFTSPYGYAVATPNLQRLATEGVLFRQAFCSAPTCSPSRAGLLTGECPHSNGMLGLAHRGFAMTPDGYDHHIVRTLRREAGYHSTLIGLQHIAADPHTIGYDQVEVIPGNRVEKVAPAAVRFLQSPPKSPFWLTVGFFEAHRPFRIPDGNDDTRYTLSAAPIPDAPDTRRDMAGFHASVRKMDAGVGQVLAALDAAGLADNTLVISTTDHGIAFPEMKCCLTDGGLGVHMIWRGPGGFTGGKVCDAMISHLDVYPTLCEMLGITPPAWLQGRSFLPVINGKTEEINDAIFAEVNYHAAYEPKRAVRTKRWKYIRNFADRTHRVLPNCDDGPSKSYFLANGWDRQTVPRESLFDLLLDPNEQNNIVNDPAHAATLDEMRKQLDTWMHSTNDPLLQGPIPPPPGAKFNDPDQTSAEEPVTTAH